MAKKPTEQKKVIVRVKKRTSIGTAGRPRNKSKKRSWKAYRGQG
jgi:hypothetical protein